MGDLIGRPPSLDNTFCGAVTNLRFVALSIDSSVVSTFPIWEKKHAEVIMPVINEVCEEYWTIVCVLKWLNRIIVHL